MQHGLVKHPLMARLRQAHDCLRSALFAALMLSKLYEVDVSVLYEVDMSVLCEVDVSVLYEVDVGVLYEVNVAALYEFFCFTKDIKERVRVSEQTNKHVSTQAKQQVQSMEEAKNGCISKAQSPQGD